MAAGPVFAWNASSFSTGDEALLFSLTNQDRASAGLNALVNDTYLHKEAEWRAKDMGDRNYFSHAIPPDGKKVFAYMSADHYCYKIAGENIGLSSWGDDVATNRIEVAFMNSASHRANILGNWVRLGVGAYKAADGRKLWAVLFSIPCAARTPAKTAGPTRVPTPKPTASPGGTPAASATGAPSPAASPTPASSAAATVPVTPFATTTARPATTPMAEAGVSSLRVYEKPASQSPADSLFHALFGGLFGW